MSLLNEFFVNMGLDLAEKKTQGKKGEASIDFIEPKGNSVSGSNQWEGPN